jgi:hypothetical protein
MATAPPDLGFPRARGQSQPQTPVGRRSSPRASAERSRDVRSDGGRNVAPGHDTPATNQYLPAAGSGATKTRLQGKLDISALDSFNCTTGTDDPLSWLDLVNNRSWIAKTS